MKKISVLFAVFMAFVSLTGSVNVFAMGRPMTEDEIKAREARAKADIEADEAKRKADIEADKARKMAAIDAREAEKKTEAWADQKKAEIGQ